MYSVGLKLGALAQKYIVAFFCKFFEHSFLKYVGSSARSASLKLYF